MSKKRAIFTIITCSIAVFFLTGVLLVGLNTDGFGFSQTSSAKDPPSFTSDYVLEIDPEEEPVEEISIDWEAGPVQVLTTRGSRIRITEGSGRELTDEEHMRVMLSKNKLEINWDHNQLRRFIHLSFFSWFNDTEKSLTVELPKSVSETLIEMNCSNLSGEMEIDGLSCQDGEFSSVSGAIRLSNMVYSEDCNVSTTSGPVTIKDFIATSLSVSTTSGAIKLEGLNVPEADFDTVSGGLTFQGDAREFTCSTVSGPARAELSSLPQELDMGSVSGDLTVVLPKTASFTADYSTVSGGFSCDFPGKDGTYGSGRPQGDLHFSTTSGDMQVIAK